MISLKRSMDSYENLRAAVDQSVTALLGTLDSLSQYMVETDHAAIDLFRKNLNHLSDRVRNAERNHLETEYEQFPADLRGILRSYRDRAEKYIEGLKSDMKSASEALFELLESMQANDSDAEGNLKAELLHLQSVMSIEGVETIRAAVRTSTERMQKFVEQLRAEKQAVIVQLKSEINVLQSRVEDLECAKKTDAATGLSNRDEFLRLLRRAMTGGKELGVVHVWLRNWMQLIVTSPAPVSEELIGAFAKRLKNAIPKEAVAGRWRDDVFCIVVPTQGLRTISSAVITACDGNYACVHEGRTQRLQLQCIVTGLPARDGEEADGLVARIEKLQHVV